MRQRLLGIVAPALIALVLVTVGSAAVAQVGPFSGSGESSDGALVEVESPRLVGQDRAADGSDLKISHSKATAGLRPQQPMTCVSTERDMRQASGEVGTPGPDRVCGPPPQEGRLTFALDTTLRERTAGEPSGEPSGEPQYFISGYTTGAASEIVVTDSAGQTKTLDSAAADGGDARVFWGAIPAGFRDGEVSLEAFDTKRAPVADAVLRIGEPPPGVPPLGPVD